MIVILASCFVEASTIAGNLGIPRMLWRPATDHNLRGTSNLIVIVGDGWKTVDGHRKELINNLLHHAKQNGRVKFMFHEESMRPYHVPVSRGGLHE